VEGGYGTNNAFSQKTNCLKIIAHVLPKFDKKIGLFANTFSSEVLIFMQNKIKYQL
jgi:hypothetical protein